MSQHQVSQDRVREPVRESPLQLNMGVRQRRENSEALDFPGRKLAPTAPQRRAGGQHPRHHRNGRSAGARAPDRPPQPNRVARSPKARIAARG